MDAASSQNLIKLKEKRYRERSNEEIEKLLDEKDKKNTQLATERAVKNFSGYLKVKSHPDIEDLDPKQLDGILLNYYSSLQPQVIDDLTYSVQTIKCIRAALNRFFRKKRGIDIVKDPDFVHCNEMFKAICVESKKSGKGAKKPHIPISPIDLERIAEYFCYDHVTKPDPKRLQQNLVFYIIYFFCRRGRENLYEMKKNTFKIVTEPDGTQYVMQDIDEIDKNHTCDDDTNTNEGRMYATNVPNSCPVDIFKLYMSKLPDKTDDMWLKPRSGHINYVDKYWYEPRKVGRDSLDRFMKLSICQNVKLDGKYTNHSIRSTVINTLDNAGFEACHIIKLSSHKSESTIKEYATRCPDNKRKEMFQSLSEAMEAPAKKQKVPASATTTKAVSSIQDVKENFPNFDLEPLDDFNTIDDTVLQEIMLEFEENSNKSKNNNNANKKSKQNENCVVPVTSSPTRALLPQNQQINTQVNTFNQNQLPRLPAMYFPNSNVTINYNFGK